MVRQYRPGIHCSRCDSPRTTVIETRNGHRHKTRTRRCNNCGHRWQTIEIAMTHLSSDPKFDFLFPQVTP